MLFLSYYTLLGNECIAVFTCVFVVLLKFIFSCDLQISIVAFCDRVCFIFAFPRISSYIYILVVFMLTGLVIS